MNINVGTIFFSKANFSYIVEYSHRTENAYIGEYFIVIGKNEDGQLTLLSQKTMSRSFWNNHQIINYLVESVGE